LPSRLGVRMVCVRVGKRALDASPNGSTAKFYGSRSHIRESARGECDDQGCLHAGAEWCGSVAGRRYRPRGTCNPGLV
jgi:hypothetical protein